MASRPATPRPSKASPSRLLAREILAEARVRGAYVRELVDARRGRDGVSREDFDFAQVLVFGVTMCAGTLDELIDRNLSSPLDVRARLRDCLRVSAYELAFLRKPEHVAVDQGVELAKAVEPRAAGLANAVLRKMAVDARAFPWGDPESDPAAFARSFGVPEWLASRLVADVGREKAASMLSACLAPAPTYLADNPFAPGEPFPADLSSQQTASLLPLSGEVLEVGSGRGTKTLLLEGRSLRERGSCARVHAVDVHEYKRGLLEERMARFGVEGVSAYAGDARDLDSIEGLPERFDAAFVDAPCSGTGTLRRHPEIRWRLSAADVEELSLLQGELLASAASRVKAGGTLVYATCSVLPAENQGVVEGFLAGEAGEGFAAVPVRREELLEGEPESALTPEGWFSSLPSDGGPDGHFAARLRRLR